MVEHRRKTTLFRGLFAAYFFAFYSTNFLLNILTALTMLIPFEVAELVTNPGSRSLLWTQDLVAVALTYLYSIVYVVNDVVDFRSDMENSVVKATLVSRQRSLKVIVIFLALVCGLLVALAIASPRLWFAFAIYATSLAILAIFHSVYPFAKPVTFFLERTARYVAPAFFIYNWFKPEKLTLIFLLSSVVAYPIMTHREYANYLIVKRKLVSSARKIELRIWTIYYVLFLAAIPSAMAISTRRDSIHIPLLAAVADTIAGVLILTAFVEVVNTGAQRLADRTMTGVDPSSSFLTRDRRTLLIKSIAVFSAAIALILLDYAR